jgi:hypothetical protein
MIKRPPISSSCQEMKKIPGFVSCSQAESTPALLSAALVPKASEWEHKALIAAGWKSIILQKIRGRNTDCHH